VTSPKRTPRIVVIGSANVDLTTFTDRFPRPGETIFGDRFHLGFGGKGANQAIAARRCGAEVTMIARLGDDLFGPATITNFSQAGVSTDHILITPGVSSGVAPIFVDSSGQNRILVVKGANDRLSPSDVDAARDVIAAADFVILQLEIPLETVYHAVEVAAECNVPSILNPAPAAALDMSRLKNLAYLIPNETEAEVLTGLEVTSSDHAKAAAETLRKDGPQRVIVTLGREGALLVTGERTVVVPPITVDAVDTTGAGDAFIGSFACFLAQSGDELDAIRKANVYAGLSTLSVGTQSSFVTHDRFDEEWRKNT
jgi:ribokinase